MQYPQNNKKSTYFSMKTKDFFMKTVHVLIFNSIADRCTERPVEFNRDFRQTTENDGTVSSCKNVEENRNKRPIF